MGRISYNEQRKNKKLNLFIIPLSEEHEEEELEEVEKTWDTT